MSKILNKRIPTLIGLIVIIVGIVITTFLVRGGQLFEIKAGPGEDPKNIQITNITDDSFTVSYVTADTVLGTINYGNDQSTLDNVSLDDRDQLSQSVNKHNIHSITIRNLEPAKNYYFTITSGDKKYTNNGTSYNAKTGNKIDTSPSSQIPMSGKVILPDGSNPSEGLVYVNINNAQKLSALIKKDGSYIVPLNSLRGQTLNDYFALDNSVIININVTSGNLISSVSISPTEIDPVPTITLSSNYDFSSQATSSAEEVNQNQTSFPALDTNSASEPQILNPTANEQFTDQQPNFAGIAIPNEIVEIEIHSDENISAQVTAGENGRWNFRPATVLSPGNHTITITAKNKDGILKKITQSFTVFAAGSQVDQSATPASTLAPTQTPDPTLTEEPTPTLEVSQIPLTPVPTLPPTGTSSVIIAMMAGATAAAAGIILFLLTRGNSSL